MEGIFTAWGRILAGHKPSLSIEITRECPLRCPGCYAYGDEHLGGGVTLRQVSDFKGDELVENFFKLVDEHKPLHLSIVGGEPLVRFRELEYDPAAPRRARHLLAARDQRRAANPGGMGASCAACRSSSRSTGCQPEHDVRRTPATYDRILKHIAGHQITVHCTVTRQQVRRDGYLEEFLRFWSANENVRTIWVSLYTPQIGEVSEEQLRARRPHARRGGPDAPAAPLSQAADARGADQGLR